MTSIEKINPLDLNIEVPRSSKDYLAGLVHLPRMVDKARAYKNETLGEYIFPCSLDQLVLNFLDVDPKKFVELDNSNEDGQIEEWAKEASRLHSPEEREALNRNILERKPAPKQMPIFLYHRELIEPGRTDVVTYVDLNDLEEGHIKNNHSYRSSVN